MQALSADQAAAEETVSSTPGPGLADLPDTVIVLIAETLLQAGGTPGDVLRLAATCKRVQRCIAAAGPVWRVQCQLQGWRVPGNQVCGVPGVDPQLWEPDALTGSWFDYYTARMQARWHVRSKVKQYVLFLDKPSAASMRPGLPVGLLCALEARLGARLPWQMWELYRFRNGQAVEKDAQFVDGARLLGAHTPCTARQLLQRSKLACRHSCCGFLSSHTAMRSDQACGDCAALEEVVVEALSLAPRALLAQAYAAHRSAAAPGGAPATRQGASRADPDASGSLPANSAPSAPAGGSVQGRAAAAGAGRPLPAAEDGAPAEQASGLGLSGLGGGLAMQLGTGAVGQAVPPRVLLPFTETIRGRQRYACDLQGHVYKVMGFNAVFMASSLTAFMQKLLR